MFVMAAPAGFLYGDATPSPLKSDFIAFLRAAVDYAVEVLGADARTVAAAREVERLAEQTELEIVEAEELATDVARSAITKTFLIMFPPLTNSMKHRREFMSDL